jgi:hypothetical protein
MCLISSVYGLSHEAPDAVVFSQTYFVLQEVQRSAMSNLPGWGQFWGQAWPEGDKQRMTGEITGT